jgi:hypothetical protein
MKRDSEEVKKELEELAPGLNRLKAKGDGFKVPANYFRKLPDEVIQQLPFSKKRDRISLWQKAEEWVAHLFQPQMRLAIAAVLILVLAGWWIFSPSLNGGEQSTPLAFEEVTANEAAAYLTENVDELDEDLLMELVSSTPSLNEFLEIELEAMEGEQLDDMVDEFFDDLEIEDLL